MTASHHSPRLKASPGFLPPPSSLPLQPEVVDLGAVGGGDTRGAGTGDATTRGAGSGGATFGGVDAAAGGTRGYGATSTGVGGTGASGTGGSGSGGTATGGAGGSGAGGTGAGGAGVGGAVGSGDGGTGADGTRGTGAGSAMQPWQQRPFFVDQPRACVSSCHTVCTRRAPRVRPPLVPGTHTMALRPSSVAQRPVLPSPPLSSLLKVPDPESDLARATSPTAMHVLATLVTNPTYEFAAASALVTELVDFADACCLDYFASLVSESNYPPSVEGELALGSDVLEDMQVELECLAVAWHDTLRRTLAALGFAPSTSDPSLFLRTDPSQPPFYIFVYVLVFATADTEALALVKAEL
ncbi:unnamed protein product [Closterium sp. NIES-54]